MYQKIRRVGLMLVGGAAVLLGSLTVPSLVPAQEGEARRQGSSEAKSGRKADPEKPEQLWTSLFDGETLSGWEMLELPGKEGQSKWEVIDGMLCGSGEASMLYSPEGNYKNFIVRAEIMVNDGGNSGMYFRCAKEPSFSSGYESQINSTHRDPIKVGSIYGMVHQFEPIVPPNTWYVQEIEVRDIDYRGKVVTSIQVRVNDQTLFQFLDRNRTHEKGHFAFQQHDPGSKVCIRQIEVMELPDETR